MEVLFSRSMQIFLAAFEQDRLVDRFTEQALVESTKAVFGVCFVQNFDEIGLFKQFKTLFDVLCRRIHLTHGLNLSQGLKFEFIS